MFLGVIDIPLSSKFHKSKRALELCCDTCEKKFERRYVKSWIERSFHFCSNECKSRARAKCGIQYDSTLSKFQQTSREKFGVDFPWQNESVKEKRKEIWVQTLGVDNPMKSLEVQQRVVETLQERFGVSYPMQSSEIRDRHRKSMLEHGSSNVPRSKGELKLEMLLREHFHSVCIQVPVSGWFIDFYIEDVDTYVQFDGVYWHGLDRPIDEIRNSFTPRDASIVRNWECDRKQDAAFRAKGLKLVRITDRDMKSPDFQLASFIT